MTYKIMEVLKEKKPIRLLDIRLKMSSRHLIKNGGIKVWLWSQREKAGVGKDVL